MSRLANKHIIIGVTGGIAAYKSPELVRRLVEEAALVQVVMSHHAQSFITPLTLQAVSGNPVRTELIDEGAEAAMSHIELARWADLIVVAPATANFMARLAGGFADDLLATLCLAARGPVALAPAMNEVMWSAAATRRNARQLEADERLLWGPGVGSQACGDEGAGRMLEPHALVEHCIAALTPKSLEGLCVVVTAGPTREAFDPVRYISNHSSGKQGFAMAAAAAAAGAHVELVTGPVSLPTPVGTHRTDLSSASEMYAAVMDKTANADIFIGVAAVSDYRPKHVQAQKIKKDRMEGEQLEIELVQNADIAACVASQHPGVYTVGFAAETQHLERHAREKRVRKGLDMIIANDVSDQSIGFNSDENAVTLVWDDGESRIASTPKSELGTILIERITELYRQSPKAR
ncbi:MAG: bifunctional phosphopantothenoylcysteine decarboxylase/phosphopantothenate--cysteine ligase CoaBC [Gammaproteobacteria bacterium]|nr:bifunctional phosphopantothenoylcysteine decarboxylase/phosphopantothenate--cysteine ligase CoaBC [Gammaproteobacteria bacterium]